MAQREFLQRDGAVAGPHHSLQIRATGVKDSGPSGQGAKACRLLPGQRFLRSLIVFEDYSSVNESLMPDPFKIHPSPCPQNRKAEVHAFGLTKHPPWVFIVLLWAVAALQSAPPSQVLQVSISSTWPNSGLQKSLVLSWRPPVMLSAVVMAHDSPQTRPSAAVASAWSFQWDPTPKPALLTLPKDLDEAKESDLPVLPTTPRKKKGPDGHPLEAQHSSHIVSDTAPYRRRYAHNSRRICNPN